jgi:hypothetical protein
MTKASVVIEYGDWAWTDDDRANGHGDGEPCLFCLGSVAYLGSGVEDAAALRRLALDLMKLANLVANQGGQP